MRDFKDDSENDGAVVGDDNCRRVFLKDVYAILDGLPVVDTRSAEEILGYNEFGFFDEEGDFSLTDVKVARTYGR